MTKTKARTRNHSCFFEYQVNPRAEFRSSGSVRGSPRGQNSARVPRGVNSALAQYEFVPHATKQAVRTANQFPLLFSMNYFHSLRSSFLHSELRIPNSEFALAPFRTPNSALRIWLWETNFLCYTTSPSTTTSAPST